MLAVGARELSASGGRCSFIDQAGCPRRVSKSIIRDPSFLRSGAAALDVWKGSMPSEIAGWKRSGLADPRSAREGLVLTEAAVRA
jgi:hypothetical protein